MKRIYLIENFVNQMFGSLLKHLSQKKDFQPMFLIIMAQQVDECGITRWILFI